MSEYRRQLDHVRGLLMTMKMGRGAGGDMLTVRQFLQTYDDIGVAGELFAVLFCEGWRMDYDVTVYEDGAEHNLRFIEPDGAVLLYCTDDLSTVGEHIEAVYEEVAGVTLDDTFERVGGESDG